MTDAAGERQRLEGLWRGEFGDAYTERNSEAGARRGPFWETLLGQLTVAGVLEIGCNVGGNLQHVARLLPGSRVVGIDVNASALSELRSRVPGVIPLVGSAAELPFRTSSFDLIFTAGVLIHQPEDTILTVMTEVIRCSSRYILAAEYAAADTEEVAYRGERGALFRRDYRRMYESLDPRLRLLREGTAGPEEGFDDVTFHLFEKV
jgi:pseudaminic acid biosynthesis-associated methylase